MILLILSRVKIDIILFYLTSIWTGYEGYEAGTMAKDIWEVRRLDPPPIVAGSHGQHCLDQFLDPQVE